MKLYKIFNINNNEEFNISECENIESISIDGVEINDSDYEISEENNLIILNEELLNGNKLTVVFYSNKEVLISHRADHRTLYSYYGEEVLEYNKEYNILIKDDYNCTSGNIITKFSPLYCKVRDIKKLLGGITDYLGDIDIEMEIFLTGVNAKEELEKYSENEKFTDALRSKLIANMTCLDIVYKYYYKLLEEAGTVHNIVGSLETKKTRLEAQLEGLKARFERNIEAILDEIRGVDNVRSFTKARNSDTGLESRLW